MIEQNNMILVILRVAMLASRGQRGTTEIQVSVNWVFKPQVT